MRGLRGADFRGGDREQRICAAFERAGSRQRGCHRCRDLAGEAREFLLDRLELADLAAELGALGRVSYRELERALERARHRDGTHERAVFP